MIDSMAELGGGGYFPLDILLNSLEEASAGTERDKGTRFETLIRDWLIKEPTYRDLFSEVLRKLCKMLDSSQWPLET